MCHHILTVVLWKNTCIFTWQSLEGIIISFMHLWLLLNGIQQSIGNFTGCFHNEHTSAMIWYLTETLSLLPKFNYIIIISRIQFGYVQAYFSFYDN